MDRVATIGFIVLVLLHIPAPVMASEWKQVVDAGYLVYELDQGSVSRKKGIVTVWSRTSVRDSEAYFPKYSPRETPYASQKSFHKINCSERTHAILAATKFDPSGRVISSMSEAQAESPIVPDSVADHYLKVVCSAPKKP